MTPLKIQQREELSGWLKFQYLSTQSHIMREFIQPQHVNIQNNTRAESADIRAHGF